MAIELLFRHPTARQQQELRQDGIENDSRP